VSGRLATTCVDVAVKTVSGMSLNVTTGTCAPNCRPLIVSVSSSVSALALVITSCGGGTFLPGCALTNATGRTKAISKCRGALAADTKPACLPAILLIVLRG
jgi:hypothetical protein